MSWADLDKVAVGKPRSDGRATLIIRDERPTSAILEARPLSTVIAISRVIRARAAIDNRYDGRGIVIYNCPEVPPGFLVDAVSAAGGVVFAAGRDHVNRLALATTVQLDGAFVDLATSVRRRFKVGNAGDALDVLEHHLRRRPIATDDVVARWTLMFELAALTGELVRADRPARWIAMPAQPLPVALDLGAAGTVIPGRMAQSLLEGGAGSMRSLVELTEVASSAAIGWRPMPLLCHRKTLALDQVAWSPLLDDQVDSPDVPVIAWVEDRDSEIAWPAGNGEPAPELRAHALANLGRIGVEISNIDVPFGTMVLVTGDFFAAEMILHAPTMRRVRAATGGSESILVGTPTRGHLIAVDGTRALIDDAMLQAFLLSVDRQYMRSPEADRISSEVILYFGDRPVGRVQSNAMDTRRALRRVGVDLDADDDAVP